ncbi:hypothetical protein OX88_27220 [Pseudomonas coronafaciens pv. porri]|uniref:hypothetical protein n=1 Tax=Pseudomonas coronafaciens TaxID=53409 RepID=UPI0006ABD0CD|nr:hypothetical protein [Pseudomonas coronafaciens]KOP50888.1 hypothetical protein OX88_27220 [Pseudomonas coronafaciens pv. porri]
MILDLDLSNNSFTKFLALVHDANELIEEIDCEYRERDSHRFSYRLYKIITQNDCKEFNLMLSHFLSELNLLAIRKPYSNQNILLLIDAFHTITSDIYYFDDLRDMFPDIKFISIREFQWYDYCEQPFHAYEEPPAREQELTIDTNEYNFDDNNEFDFSDDVLSTNLNKDEASNKSDDFNDFNCGNDPKPAGEMVIRKPNTINEKEVERRAIALAESAKSNTITESDIKEHAFDMDDESDFDFGSNSTPAGEKKSPINTENEFKPWVKPFISIAALAIVSLFIYGYFF